MNIFSQHLSSPEYIHVMLNPLPVYGLAIATLALVLGLFLRHQRVTIAALVLVFITALSAWPTYHYGQAGYDRVKSMSDDAGGKWLDEHMRRGEKLIWMFYVLAGVSAIGIATVTKWPRHSRTVSIATIALASATLGTGGYIAYAGGHVRHREFRFEPPPEMGAEEHHHHDGDEHEHEASPVQQMEHAGHAEAPSPAGEQSTPDEERKQLEASRLQLDASRLQLEASRKQLEAAGGASPSASPPAEHKHDDHPQH